MLEDILGHVNTTSWTVLGGFLPILQHPCILG